MLPTTTSMLLENLLDEDRVEREGAWTAFDARYRPVLAGFARRLGLGPEDAREVTQDALVTFMQEFRAGGYDDSRGRLRSWLFAITRARVLRLRRARAYGRLTDGGERLDDLPGEDGLAQLWETEWRRATLREGLERLRASRMDETTLRAFEAVALEGRAPAEVAQALGLTVNAVYLAKFRAVERLRTALAEVERDWE